MTTNISASEFVKGYCKKSGITEREFYATQIPMPDQTSPSGWAAVSNNPMSIKAHVDLYSSQQPAPVVPELRVDWQENEFSAGWNACRAAMLAAAQQSPGSEPDTVPGKWIPVSERMPIDFEAVIAFDGDQVYGEAMYSSDDGFTIDGYEPCDRLNLRNVTHWMPMPAAPQEVK